MDYITQARQCLSDARALLARKARRSGPLYTRKKYVRQAGEIAWKGLLLAVNGTFRVYDPLEEAQHNHIRAYVQVISQHNEEMAKLLANTFDTLYYCMCCDGNLSWVIVNVGLTQADALINWCAALSAENND